VRSKPISLQAAKTRVNMALRTYLFAKERGYPCHNYPMLAYTKAGPLLEQGDGENFDQWYSEIIQPEIERIRANYDITEPS